MNLFIIFLVSGVLLIGAEIFAPGAVLGILGSLLLVAAAITGFIEFGPAGGAYALLGIITMSVVGIILWMKFFPGSIMGKKIIVANDLSTSKSAPDFSNLVGQEGLTASELRPAGFAAINGKRIDVVTQGEMLSKDERVRVIKVEGSRVIVQSVNKSS